VENAELQVGRVAKVRGMSVEEIRKLMRQTPMRPILDFWATPGSMF